jgi:hypothetical protein
MRSIAIVIALIVSLHATAQQWCSPGAEWRYPYITQLHPQQGTLRYTYEGDSLYQGEVCQHFESRVYFPDQTQWGPWHSFTTTAPGVILFWNTLVSQFDTLVNFDAVPGTGWSIIGFQSQEYFITVQDTGISTIDGIPLRYLVITSDPPWFGQPTDTIYERVGALNLHNFSPIENYVMETPTLNGVGCYQDDEMQYTRLLPPWLETPCDMALSLLDQSTMTGTTLTVYPNPVHDRFWIAGPSQMNGTATIRVLDGRGAVLGMWRMSGNVMQFDTDQWPSGLYLVEAMDDRHHFTARWLKQ